MSLLGLVLIAIGLYFAFKVAGLVLKLLMWALVVVGLLWLLGPHLG
jgi:hypothetical protein